MKITIAWKVAINAQKVIDKVEKAVQRGLVDSVTVIANDAIQLCVVDTGHNRRSIAYKVGNKSVRKGRPKGDEKPFEEGQPDLKTLEGAIYSTSGYGGFLETGTARMEPRPYIKPAFDMNIKNLPKNIKGHLA